MMRDLVRATIRDILAHVPRKSYEPRQRHVWLLRPDHLGDLLFVRPGLARFRALLPDWHITLAVGPWSRTVVASDPNLDDIVEIAYPGFSRDASVTPWAPYRLLQREAERVRLARPEAVVVLRDDHWWGALLARLAGVPLIVGADRPEMRGLLTRATGLTADHSVARNIELLDFAASCLGADPPTAPVDFASAPLRWEVSVEDDEAATGLLRSIGVTRPFVAIHPGSGAAVKLWPAERWARVAGALVEAGVDVVLTGGRAEQELLDHIRGVTERPIASLGGMTSLSVLAGVFHQSLVVAGVDSGPLHLAVAAGVPTVHIYGPSEPDRFGPWGDPRRHRVVSAKMRCDACGNLSGRRQEGAGCMLAVRAGEVIDAISGLLER